MKRKYIVGFLIIFLLCIVSCTTEDISSNLTIQKTSIEPFEASAECDVSANLKNNKTLDATQNELLSSVSMEKSFSTETNEVDEFETTELASSIETTPAIVYSIENTSVDDNQIVESNQSTRNDNSMSATIEIPKTDEFDSIANTTSTSEKEVQEENSIPDRDNVFLNEKSKNEVFIEQNERDEIISISKKAEESSNEIVDQTSIEDTTIVVSQPSEKINESSTISSDDTNKSQIVYSDEEKSDLPAENDACDLESSETINRLVEERDSIATLVFGVASVLVLIVVIILSRRKDKKIFSIIFFVIFVILLTLHILFIEHVFCNHKWNEATCVQPRKCELCGKVDGKSLGHDFVFSKTKKESTCSNEGISLYVCSRCGESMEKLIAKKDHVQGKVVITKPASYNQSGTYSYYCNKCNKVYKTESFELSAAEKEKSFKESCNRYSYDSLARRPESFKGLNVKLAGKVIQVLENGNSIQLLVEITQEKASYSSTYFYDDSILVKYTRTSGERILEGDIVALYGVMAGNYTYETVLGAERTVPLMKAKYINRINHSQYNNI